MNSRQRRKIKREYPYIREFIRTVDGERSSFDEWIDLLYTMQTEAIPWCNQYFGKKTCIFKGDLSSFSLRFRDEKAYNWFLLKWL